MSTFDQDFWAESIILKGNTFQDIPAHFLQIMTMSEQGLGVNILNGNSENLTPYEQVSLVEQNNKCYDGGRGGARLNLKTIRA